MLAAYKRLFDPRAPDPAQVPDFEAVFAAQFDFVWSSVRRMGVEEAHVDDAVQDVFVAVHRRLSDFVGGSLRAWIFQFIVRVAATHRRTARNASRLKGGDARELERVPDAHTSPEEQLEARQSRDLLTRLLAGLTEQRRAVFVLAELEELPMPEVAEALKLNLNTAYSRLREARRDLQEGALRERAREDWRRR